MADIISTSLTQALLDGFIARLREQEPDLQAVLMAGSYARGEGDTFSDLDLIGVVPGTPQRESTIWFERIGEGRLLHVSVGWEALEAAPTNEPASWALGFPAVDVQQYIWATAQARSTLGDDPSCRLPPRPPELEDFVELFMKVKRAAASSNALPLRWAARTLAEYAPPLLPRRTPQNSRWT